MSDLRNLFLKKLNSILPANMVEEDRIARIQSIYDLIFSCVMDRDFFDIALDENAKFEEGLKKKDS
jgi:hypothetical protein